MKNKNTKITIMTSITIATLLIAGSSFMGMQNVYAPALVTNGSFDNGSNDCDGLFEPLNSVSTEIDGWSVDSGSIDWICSYWDPSDVPNSLDMSGAVAGSIHQDLNTVVGAEYKVTFDMSGNPDGGDTIKSMTVSAADDSTLYLENQGLARDNMQWQSNEFCFRAIDTTTALTFTSNQNSIWGPALDNVAAEMVVEIPGDGIDSNCDGLDYPTMYESANGLFWKEIQEECVDGLPIATDSWSDCDLWITYHGDVAGFIIDTIPAHLDVVDPFNSEDLDSCDVEFSNKKGKESGNQANKKPRVTSSTKVSCEVTESDEIYIDTQTRLSPSVEKSNKPNKIAKYSPTGCGEFEVNGGLIYYEELDPNGDPIVLDSIGPIFVHTTPGDLDCDDVPNDQDICQGNDDNLDADNDGVPDGCDICQGNDDNLDADNDGVPDGCDICQGNDDNLDADNDGVPDGCDICEGDDASTDTDGDLVCNDIDPVDDDACFPDNQDPLCVT